MVLSYNPGLRGGPSSFFVFLSSCFVIKTIDRSTDPSQRMNDVINSDRLSFAVLHVYDAVLQDSLKPGFESRPGFIINGG